MAKIILVLSEARHACIPKAIWCRKYRVTGARPSDLSGQLILRIFREMFEFGGSVYTHPGGSRVMFGKLASHFGFTFHIMLSVQSLAT